MGNDFGHTAINGTMGGMPFHVDSWGSGPFIIDGIMFEDSDRFGPALLRKDGELKKNPYPPEKHPFWRKHMIWVRQGRRVREDGKTCVWHEPKPTKVRRMFGNNFEVVEIGEEDGLMVIEPECEPVLEVVTAEVKVPHA